MTTTSNPIQGFSPFLGASSNIPEEDDRAKVFLQDQFSAYADVINDKRIGIVSEATENFSGGKIYYRTPTIIRNEYQALTYIPSLPNATTLTITLDGIPTYPIPAVNSELVITNLYGTASRPPSSTGAGDGDYFAFMNEGNSQISFTMSDNVIVITTTVDLSDYIGFIFVSYVRNGL